MDHYLRNRKWCVCLVHNQLMQTQEGGSFGEFKSLCEPGTLVEVIYIATS